VEAAPLLFVKNSLGGNIHTASRSAYILQGAALKNAIPFLDVLFLSWLKGTDKSKKYEEWKAKYLSDACQEIVIPREGIKESSDRSG